MQEEVYKPFIGRYDPVAEVNAIMPESFASFKTPPYARVANHEVEEYREGYPRYTALLSAHKPYFVCRPFNKLRARLLLLKQDHLDILEKRLEEIDNQEPAPLFLGKSRFDRNEARKKVLAEIELCLEEYDRYLERTNRVLSLCPAQERDVHSLRNWVNGTGSLAREETAYLSSRELVSLAPLGDNATVKLEAWVENLFIKFYAGFRRSKSHDLSNDPNVFIDSGPLVQRTSRAILLFLITLLLLMPVVICSTTNSNWIRIVIVLTFTVCYLLIVSILTQSRTMELILAGSTYVNPSIFFQKGHLANLWVMGC
ncbi:unnamed protein product, partial [Clonostachys solani]